MPENGLKTESIENENTESFSTEDDYYQLKRYLEYWTITVVQVVVHSDLNVQDTQFVNLDISLQVQPMLNKY